MRVLFPVAMSWVLLVASACTEAPPPSPPPEPVAAPAPPPALSPARTFEVRSARVRPNETIAGALGRVGVELPQTHELVAALTGVFDFRKSRPDDELRVTLSGGVVDFFAYRRGPVEEYVVRRDGNRYLGSARAFEIEKQVARVEAHLRSSLYEAIADAGEDAQLALALADVFAWDVDFFLDPRSGDSFSLVVEKYIHDGKLVRYGDILAAQYDGQLTGKKQLFRYENPRTGEGEYYAQDGSAARRAFLKSPIKFAGITSGYGNRFHPVLKYNRRHAGVDLRASTGTPVWSVGDGTVTRAGWGGACGNMVSVRHVNGLETIYCHFSKLGAGIRKGVRVRQKQIIGYVGATGRVTGPHLHYAVKRGGHFINPFSIKVPPAAPLPADELPQFRASIEPHLSRLEGARVAAIGTPALVGP